MATARSHTAHPTKYNIVLVGGGSGGHITPLLSVAEELKKQQPLVRLDYIGQAGDKLSDLPRKHKVIDSSYSIMAGKFRRYHGEGFKQIFDLKTLLKNIRDFFYFIVGLWQAFWLLGKLKPGIIFIKGGFVGVPVGLAAALRGIPYITHDSDAIPGLANRIISRWAEAHTVALPKSVYKYPAGKTHSVGVPVSSMFSKVNTELKTKYRRQIGLTPNHQIIFVSGGGNGAKRLNLAVVQSVIPLIKSNSKFFIVHGTGRDHESETKQAYDKLLSREEQKQILVKGFFINDLYKYSGAADVVITRAGATSIAEYAAQQKCCIIVPNSQLAGGHQTKNADFLSLQNAAVVLPDDVVVSSPHILTEAVISLLSNELNRQKLAKNLNLIARPRATKDIAQLLLERLN